MLSHVRLRRVAVISKDQLRHIEAESGKRCRLISGYEIFAGAVHHEDGFAQLRRGWHLHLTRELERFVVLPGVIEVTQWVANHGGDTKRPYRQQFAQWGEISVEAAVRSSCE